MGGGRRPVFRQHGGMLANAQNIQNQGNAAVAHDRRSGKTGEALELFSQRFDDDLLGVVDLIDHQAELRFDPSKPAGMTRKLMDSSLAKQHGCDPGTDIDQGMVRTYTRYLESAAA